MHTGKSPPKQMSGGLPFSQVNQLAALASTSASAFMRLAARGATPWVSDEAVSDATTDAAATASIRPARQPSMTAET